MAGNGTRLNFISFGFPDDDDGAAVVQLSRPIKLYGVDVSTLTVGANGAVLPYASTSLTFSNKSVPSSTAPTFDTVRLITGRVTAPSPSVLDTNQSPNASSA
jgi:hypothetical protein